MDDFIQQEGESIFDNLNAIEEQILEDIAAAFDDTEDEIKDTEGLDPDLNFKKVTLEVVIAATELRIQWE